MTDLDSASLLFSLLGLVALAGIVVAWPVLVAAAASLDPAVRARDELVAVVGPIAIAMALVVAAVAVGGSLWFSEVVGLRPCTLCWYQRAAIYPQVVVLAVAVITAGARWPRIASLVLAAVGVAISSYHVAIEVAPSLDAGACSAAVPCSLVWFRRFGFVTLPVLAWCTSASIAWLVLVAGRWRLEDDPHVIAPGGAQ